LQRLKSKYGGSCASIIECLRNLESAVHDEASLREELTRCGGMVRAHEEKIVEMADTLSKRRRTAAVALEGAVNAAIGSLGMADARLSVALDGHQEGGLAATGEGGTRFIHEDGAEEVRFLFEANPREGFKPLDKIASGGELSRLLLAFKSVTAPSGSGMLYIFDEIDAGLGGQTAHAVARQIKSLAGGGQVFLISHLQQLAAVADVHLRIAKKTAGGRARVSIEVLQGDERVAELARMVAGDQVTERTLEFAAELTRPRPPKSRRAR